jgi:exodeoxyribonuclease VII large subunit
MRVAAEDVWTVAQVVARVKRHVEADEALQHLWVVGEVSNFKAHSSGHWYFTLKDSAQMPAVMFRTDAIRSAFRPEDGVSVLAFGRVGVYERQGQTQLYVQHLEPFGAGRAALELEQVKKRLQAEGLFSRPKRPIPVLPRAVGVVTSGTGAALADIQTVAGRRFPGLTLMVFPVAVQGDAAPAAIVDGLQRAGRSGVDVIILARGGGSREDLSAFNAEIVVRAVAASPVPVVSAVGHEVDESLSDLAADLRAPTPSAAAEMVVPERRALEGQLASLRGRLEIQLQARVGRGRERIAAFSEHGMLAHPELWLAQRRMDVLRLEDAVQAGLARSAAARGASLAELRGRLRGVDPTAIMERGYAWVTHPDGRPAHPGELGPGQALHIRWRHDAWAVTTERPLNASGPPADGGVKGDGHDRVSDI